MRLIPSRLSARRRGLPSEVREAMHLVRGEHVIAYTTTESGGYAVATDRALYLPQDGVAYDRLGWERIARATYQQGVLHVSGAGEPGSTPPVHHVPLPQPGRLADAVHDRVTSAIVVSHHVALEGRSGVRFIARRPPTPGAGADDLVWSMSFDEGLDPSDPEVLDRAALALEDLRRQMGV